VKKLETDKLKEIREEMKKKVAAMEADNAKQLAELEALMGKAEEAETSAAEERRRNATLLEELRLKNEEVARQILEAGPHGPRRLEALRTQQIESQRVFDELMVKERIAREAKEAKAKEDARKVDVAQAAQQARIEKMAQDRRDAEADAKAKRPTWMGTFSPGAAATVLQIPDAATYAITAAPAVEGAAVFAFTPGGLVSLATHNNDTSGRFS
jgi:hypothetical protein